MPEPSFPPPPPSPPPPAPSPAPPPRGDKLDWRFIHLWQIQWVRDLLIIAGFVGLIWLGHRLSLVTVPMLLALLLAYLFEPLVRVVTRTPMFSRPGAALAIIALGFFIVIVPVTLGVGTATVQGIRVARGVARTSGDFLTVLRFTKDAMDDPAAGTVELKDDPAAQGEKIPQFGPGQPPPAGTPAAQPQPGPDIGDEIDQPEEAARPRAVADRIAESRFKAERAATAYRRLPSALKRAALSAIERQIPAAPTKADEHAKQSEFYLLLDQGIAWVQGHSAAVGTALGRSAIGTGAEAVGAALRTVRKLGELVLMALLTAFFFYFFSTGYGRVLAFWERLIPERRKGRVIELVRRMDNVIAGFVRGRLTICAILMAYYTLAYWLIGLRAPLLLGPLVGAAAIVPFATTLAIPLVIILMLVDPSGVSWQQNWWWVVFAPIGLYMIERALDDYVLTPLIQGKHTEMAVPAILFASLAGGVLAGVYGLLIAIPVAACLRILLREVFWPKVRAWGEGRERDFLPISR